MSRRNTTTALSGLSLALLLLLTGCGDEDAGGEATDAPPTASASSDSDGGSASGGDTTPTACVAGRWSADVEDLAAQIGAILGDTGVDVIATRAIGTQFATFGGDGAFRFDNDLTVVIDVRMSDGPAMTAAQTHVGGVTASWAWDAPSDRAAMVFADYDDVGYAVDTTVSVNGVAIDVPIEIPELISATGRMFVSCAGGEMVTMWEDSPFVTTWTRL